MNKGEIAMLADMRREQREDRQVLSDKLDEGFTKVVETMNAHEVKDTERFGQVDKRLVVVESTRKTIRWLASALVVAALGGFADLVVNHLSKGVHP